jgi:hypothetical protein
MQSKRRAQTQVSRKDISVISIAAPVEDRKSLQFWDEIA